MLAACGSVPVPPEAPPGAAPVVAPAPAPAAAPAAAPIVQGKSRWQPVDYSELPGFADDALHEAWNAWLKSCERPHPAFAPLCP